MFGRLRSRLRHPFYPTLPVTQAAAAAEARHTVLAGNFEELATAAARGVQVTHAVFLVQDEAAALDDRDQRDALWIWFQVPSFRVVLDSRGRPTAYECEAQEGLHVAAPLPSADYDTALCPCGRPGPRLRMDSMESVRGVTTPARRYSSSAAGSAGQPGPGDLRSPAGETQTAAGHRRS